MKIYSPKSIICLDSKRLKDVILETVLYFDWKTVLYIYVCGQCRTQFMLPNSSLTCTLTTGKSVTTTLTTGMSVVLLEHPTIILCLHVLIARRILLILDMLIIFSEYRCLKR